MIDLSLYYFVMAAVVVVIAVGAVWFRSKYRGFRPNGATYFGWSVIAAMVVYLLYRGWTHA